MPAVRDRRLLSARDRRLLVSLVAVLVLAVAVAGVFVVVDEGPPGGTADASEQPTPAGADSPVTVAVLDSGIDDNHPDLAGQVVDRIDLTGDTPTHPENGTDSRGHGTFVAGVVAGTGAASDGDHAGVAPGADLVDVRIVGDDPTEADEKRLADGIEYAVDEADADVILLSLNSVGPEPETVAESVEWAVEEDTVVVASAGNRGDTRSITTPGTTPAAISVGAANESAVRAASSRGPTLDGAFKPEVVAHGERVTAPTAPYNPADDPYRRGSGTSVAAAHAAGVAAELRAAEPSLSPAAVQARLASTARPLDGTAGYEAGSGVVDLDRVLEPTVTAEPGVIDFGVIGENGTATQTVTLQNHDSQPHTVSFDTPLWNADAGTNADQALSVNRSEVTVPAGGQEHISVAVDTAVSSGAYAGELRYDVAGEPRSVAVGFLRGGRVTVEKRPLSENGTVDGDELLVFTEEGTHEETLEFTNGTAEFVAGGGTYVLWSAGIDRPTDSLSLLSERHAFDGPARVRLDEAETSRAGVDVAALEGSYGPLENRSVMASLSTDTAAGTQRLSRTRLDVDNRTVRVSPDPDTAVTTAHLLATENDSTGVSEVFQLGNQLRGGKWAMPRTITADDLETTTYRLRRSAVDRPPEVQERVSVRGANDSSQLTWFDTDATIHRVHRTPDIEHERRLRSDGLRVSLPAGEAAVDTLSHPFIARVTQLSATNESMTAEVRPLADGTGAEIAGDGSLRVTVDGETVRDQQLRDHEERVTVPRVTADAASVRLDGRNPDERLSTRTLTAVELPGGVDGPVPLVTDISLEDISADNAVDPGDVSVRVVIDEPRAVESATVWHASGGQETPPWEAPDEWNRSSARVGYEAALANLSVPDSADTVSVAAELTTADGVRIRSMTANAAHVGSAVNTSTRSIAGRLTVENGHIADNDTVIAVPDGDGSPFVTRTDGDGQFELEVPKDRSYALQYRRGEPWRLNTSADADRPAAYALGVVDTTDAVVVDRTLPAPSEVEIAVADERGLPVENATVSVVHRGNGSTADVLSVSGDDSLVAPGGDDRLRLAGDIEVRVDVPDEPVFSEARLEETVTVASEPETMRLVVGTEPPEATLSASRERMLDGTPTTLNASASDVPAGADEYRWDLTGDGHIDRTTTAPRVRYTPDTGTTTPAVTVVDAAGKEARAETTVSVVERG